VNTNDYDVAIVGGGLVGASLALALADTRLRVVLIEAVAPESAAQPSFDERTTALGNGSRRIFESLGIWPDVAAEAGPIETIHISDAGRFGFARLRAAEQGIDAFGYVVPNRVLGAALWRQLRKTAVHLEVPACPREVMLNDDVARLMLDSGAPLTASLVIAADGAESRVRAAAAIDATVKDYAQMALVTTLQTSEPHRRIAYERFTRSGPIALLPLASGRFGAIWTLPPPQAAAMMSADEPLFLRELQHVFGWRAGRLEAVGRRSVYPLRLTQASAMRAARSVLIGNAAQTLHPVAGQGFNLGLRDAAMLAEVLVQVPAGSDVGAPEVLERFSQWRAQDRRGVIGFTDGLVRLFGDSRLGMGAVRDVGLLLFDLAPAAKRELARVSTGFGGRMPRLARGLPLATLVGRGPS